MKRLYMLHTPDLKYRKMYETLDDALKAALLSPVEERDKWRITCYSVPNTRRVLAELFNGIFWSAREGVPLTDEDAWGITPNKPEKAWYICDGGAMRLNYGCWSASFSPPYYYAEDIAPYPAPYPSCVGEVPTLPIPNPTDEPHDTPDNPPDTPGA